MANCQVCEAKHLLNIISCIYFSLGFTNVTITMMSVQQRKWWLIILHSTNLIIFRISWITMYGYCCMPLLKKLHWKKKIEKKHCNFWTRSTYCFCQWSSTGKFRNRCSLIILISHFLWKSIRCYFHIMPWMSVISHIHHYFKIWKHWKLILGMWP